MSSVHVLPSTAPANGRPHEATAHCWCGASDFFRTLRGKPVFVHRLSPRADLAWRLGEGKPNVADRPLHRRRESDV